MKLYASALLAASIAVSSPSLAGTITEFSTRSDFNASVGATIIDDFQDTGGAIVPGTSVTRGSVTYSAVNTPNPSLGYFDRNAGICVGDGCDDFEPLPPDYGISIADRTADDTAFLLMTFETPISAFAFNTIRFGDRTFTLAITFSDGGTFESTYDITAAHDEEQFFGFVSSLTDITSASFRYGGSTVLVGLVDDVTIASDATDVPEPAALGLLGLGVLALGSRRRRTA